MCLLRDSIWVESEPGKGSVFAFESRVRKGTPGQPGPDCLSREAQPEEASCKDMFRGRCMLLAEDIEINREIIKVMLEDTGIAIVEAENGQTACELFEKSPEKFDLLLMDIQMPVMDGYTAAETIRGKVCLPQAKDVPILAMTANKLQEDIERCMKAGMNGHVGKPVDMPDLIRKMKQCLAAEGTGKEWNRRESDTQH